MFGNKKTKTPFVVVLSFSRRTVAEIAKNTLFDKQVLNKILIKEKSIFAGSDFTYFNFVNDDNKVFRVIFQVLMKEKEKFRKRLFNELKSMFDCSDIEIVNKQDFDFSKYNLKNPLVRGEINTANQLNGTFDIDLEEANKVASVSNEKYISQSFEQDPFDRSKILQQSQANINQNHVNTPNSNNTSAPNFNGNLNSTNNNSTNNNLTNNNVPISSPINPNVINNVQAEIDLNNNLHSVNPTINVLSFDQNNEITRNSGFARNFNLNQAQPKNFVNPAITGNSAADFNKGTSFVKYNKDNPFE